MEVTLTKIKSSHDRLRGGSISGWCSGLPAVNQQLVIFAGERDRMVRTSEIRAVVQTGEGEYVVLTHNSTYLLEVHEGPAA